MKPLSTNSSAQRPYALKVARTAGATAGSLASVQKAPSSQYVWSASSSRRRSHEALAQPLLSIGWSVAATVMPQQRQYFFLVPG